KEVEQVIVSASHVAANHRRVVRLQLTRVGCMARKDTVAEARGVPLDLPLDCLRAIARVSRGNMAIGPTRLPAGGCSCGIELRLLGDQDKRLFRQATGGDL